MSTFIPSCILSFQPPLATRGCVELVASENWGTGSRVLLSLPDTTLHYPTCTTRIRPRQTCPTIQSQASNPNWLLVAAQSPLPPFGKSRAPVLISAHLPPRPSSSNYTRTPFNTSPRTCEIESPTPCLPRASLLWPLLTQARRPTTDKNVHAAQHCGSDQSHPIDKSNHPGSPGSPGPAPFSTWQPTA